MIRPHHNRYRLHLALVVVGLLGMPVMARADIYQQVDADGVVCFTDSPTDSGYTLLLRDRKESQAAHAPRRTMPAHLAAISAAALSIQDSTDKRATSRVGGSLPVQGRVTSLAGLRNDPFDGKLRHHNGMDIACPSGTPVKPVAAGTVIFSGTRPGYGNVVVVEHPDGTITLYAHNSRNLASNGEQVDPTTIIATTGSTGRSTGPHLHFEAWHDGRNITHTFLPNQTTSPPVRVLAEAPTRRYLQPDGTLVFTNLP
jgi:murein DD-endopeptidase MepM/ murein hydrolase activator NlpD